MGKKGDMRRSPSAGDSPERTCVVTRKVAAPDSLIRFVAGPGDTVVPDLACRLPGRGVWVTANRRIVEKAIASRAFARGLKAAATAAPDLPDEVDRLLEKRVVDALSLANKAGLVTVGFTRVEAAILAGEVAVLLHASDAAEDGVGKLDRLYKAICRDLERMPRVFRVLDNLQMSLALGRANVVHAALGSGGATEKLMRGVERLIGYRQDSEVEHESNTPAPVGAIES